jgi:hypothetical protein
MDQLVQIFGSLLILVAFAGAQRGTLAASSYRYLVLNFAGSAVLSVLAAREAQWGFLLLEASWATVSGWGLIQRLRQGRLEGAPGNARA